MKPRYLGDALSFLRALAVVPFACLMWTEALTAASFILGLAWLTDLLDGRLAKKWGGLRDRHPKLDIDGIADSVLALGSTGMVVVYMARHYGLHSWQFVVAGTLALACAISALVMVTFLAKVGENPVTSRHRLIVGSNMIVGHGLLQIGATLVWLAYASEGLGQAIAAVIVLACIAIAQNEKIALWYHGRLQ